ncbi:hypothetical protein GCM10009735_17180 [Actinomadura chokoriensis]
MGGAATARQALDARAGGGDGDDRGGGADREERNQGAGGSHTFSRMGLLRGVMPESHHIKIASATASHDHAVTHDLTIFRRGPD